MEKAQEEGEKLTKREVELGLTVLKNRGGAVNDTVRLDFDRPLLRITDISKEGAPWQFMRYAKAYAKSKRKEQELTGQELDWAFPGNPFRAGPGSGRGGSLS